MADLERDNAAGKQGRSLLPVLIVLFLISYGLLATLVVEQGRTIEAQRDLIRSLFSDSVQLSALRMKTIPKKPAEAPPAQAQPKSTSPRSKAPTQDSKKETPAAQSTPEPKSRSGGKLRRAIPERPPKGAFDQGDERRARISI